MAVGFRRRRNAGFRYGSSVYCSICGRPLTDPTSVRYRMGPECRKANRFHSSRSSTAIKRYDNINTQNIKPTQPQSYVRKPLKFLFTTPLGRSLLINATIHALSPIPGMAPVVVAYDVYKAYKYARMGHEVYTAVERWSQHERKDLLKTERNLRKQCVDDIMGRTQSSIMNMATVNRMDVTSYSDMMRGTLSESAGHGFEEFAGFVLS